MKGRSFEKIVFTTDLSEESWLALDCALAVAASFSAELILLSVVQDPSCFTMTEYYSAGTVFTDLQKIKQEAMARTEEELHQKVSTLAPAVRTRVVVAEGTNVPRTILEEVDKLDADLVVLATHGRSGLVHVFMGSTAERIVRSCPVPVLTVRVNEG